jgi:hypothetical protein
MTAVQHRCATVNGQGLFYRDAGPAGRPTAVIRGFLARAMP